MKYPSISLSTFFLFLCIRFSHSLDFLSLSCYFHVPQLSPCPPSILLLPLCPASLPSTSFFLLSMSFPFFLSFLSCALVLRPLIAPSVCSSLPLFPLTRILLFHPVHLFTLFLRFSLCVSPSLLLSLLPLLFVYRILPSSLSLSPFICTLSTALFSFLIPLRSFQLVFLRLSLLFQRNFPSSFSSVFSLTFSNTSYSSPLPLSFFSYHLSLPSHPSYPPAPPTPSFSSSSSSKVHSPPSARQCRTRVPPTG